MPLKNSLLLRRFALLVFAATACSTLQALDVKGVAIHGAISETFSLSDRFNYLGDTADHPSLNVSEAILNGTYRFENGLRLSAQLYAYQLGDYEALSIDFATASYRFSRGLEINLGRVKRPHGLYGNSQDIDLVRPMAFLPLDFYAKPFRPVGSAFDGGSLSGNISLGRAGGLDYEAYLGETPAYDADTPFALSVNDAAPFITTDVETSTTWGGALIWNTPLEGLRAGLTYMDAELTYGGVGKTAAQLAVSPSESRYLPTKFPAGVWAGSVAGKPVTSDIVANYTVTSLEYTRDRWSFAAEHLYIRRHADTVIPILGRSIGVTEQDSYYVMATYDASDRWHFGAYYAEAHSNINDRKGRKNVILPPHRNWLKDLSVAVAYNLRPLWVVKAEVHALNGTKGIISTDNGDAAVWPQSWGYYVLKTTISF